MDYRNLTPVGDSNISNRANKDFLFLILLLILVAGVLFWQNVEVTFVPQLFNRIKAMIGPKILFSEDSGLDLSEINISSFAPKGASEDKEEEPAYAPEGATADKEEENGIGGPLIGELPGEEKPLTLEEIQQEVIRIAKEVERIDKEVQILVAEAKYE